MNLNTMSLFRQQVYESFEQAADALFNTMDALSSEAAARSFPEWSLSPFFVRKWPSLYEAFEDGKIDAERLREAFVQFAPLPGAGQHIFLGVDTSSLFRPEALTSADRTLLPLPNVPEASHGLCWQKSEPACFRSQIEPEGYGSWKEACPSIRGAAKTHSI